MKLSKIQLILITALCVGVCFAAGPPPPPPPTPPNLGPVCWPPPCIPIDGGIGFLMAAGAAYGAKKLSDYRKKSKTGN